MLLIDAANVIGSRPDGWWRNRQRAVVNLVDLLDAWASEVGEPVTVVFDGDRPPELGDAERAVEVCFAGRGRSADDEIARRVAPDPGPGSLLVVTSDAELARRVEAGGARVLGAGAFRRRLDTVPSGASPPRRGPTPGSPTERSSGGVEPQAPPERGDPNPTPGR